MIGVGDDDSIKSKYKNNATYSDPKDNVKSHPMIIRGEFVINTCCTSKDHHLSHHRVFAIAVGILAVVVVASVP